MLETTSRPIVPSKKRAPSGGAMEPVDLNCLTVGLKTLNLNAPSSENNPAEELEILKALTSELPDANEDLYVQIHLQNFEPFPKLPTELRAKIWEATFPSSRKFILGALASLPHRRFIAPPIASRINQESRQVSLLVYKEIQQMVYERGNHPGGWMPPKFLKKVLFNPYRDFICAPFHMFLLRRDNAPPGYVHEKVKNFPEYLSNTQILEMQSHLRPVTGFHLHQFTHDQVLKELRWGVLECFLGRLEEVRFVHGDPKTTFSETIWNEDTRKNGERLLGALKEYFAEKEAENKAFKVPRLSMRDYRV